MFSGVKGLSLGELEALALLVLPFFISFGLFVGALYESIVRFWHGRSVGEAGNAFLEGAELQQSAKRDEGTTKEKIKRQAGVSIMKQVTKAQESTKQLFMSVNKNLAQTKNEQHCRGAKNTSIFITQFATVLHLKKQQTIYWWIKIKK